MQLLSIAVQVHAKLMPAATDVSSTEAMSKRFHQPNAYPNHSQISVLGW